LCFLTAHFAEQFERSPFFCPEGLDPCNIPDESGLKPFLFRVFHPILPDDHPGTHLDLATPVSLTSLAPLGFQLFDFFSFNLSSSCPLKSTYSPSNIEDQQNVLFPTGRVPLLFYFILYSHLVKQLRPGVILSPILRNSTLSVLIRYFSLQSFAVRPKTN